MVAAASFWVSWLSYRRDRGQIDFNVGIWGTFGGNPLRKEQDVVRFQLVNSGRRPLILDSIGGRQLGQRLKALLSLMFPSIPFLQPEHFVIFADVIRDNLGPNGEARILCEGEKLSFSLPLPRYSDLLKDLARKADQIWITDSIGNKHVVPKKVLRKLRTDYKKRLKKI